MQTPDLPKTKLAQLMADKRISQSTLLKLVNKARPDDMPEISRSMISRWVSGEYQPRPERAVLIEKALGVTAGSLFEITPFREAKSGAHFSPASDGHMVLTLHQRVTTDQARRIMAILSE